MSQTIDIIRQIEAECLPADMRISSSDLEFIVRNNCFVVREDIGFITYLPIATVCPDSANFKESDLLDLYCPGSRILFIFGIAVRPSFQRRHVANELLNSLPPSDCIFTEAVSPSGIRFFERNGFEALRLTTDGQLMRRLAMPAIKSA